MKIKQQQQHQQQQANYLTNANTTNGINILSGLSSISSSNTTSNATFTMTSNQSASNELNSSLLANTTIWTRSAAFKAAQLESNTSTPTSASTATNNSLNENLIATTNLNNNTLSKRNHNHHHFGTHHSSNHHHHGHYQHVLGKIVKPIPVRPMSSSSSSSSTHSSLFNSSSSNTNHLAGVLKSINHSTHNATSNLDSAPLTTTDIEIDSINSSSSSSAVSNSAGNFSLIAKYFASFPATRLKSTSSGNQTTSIHEATANIHHNVNCPHHQGSSQSPVLLKSNDLFHTRNHETPTPTSATLPPQTRNRTNTFMPFKKSNQNKTQSTTSPASNLNDLNTSTDKIQSTFTLRSQSAFNNKIQQQQQLVANLTINNTDHLCTNFKRMIKLSDNHFNHTIESDPASPLTAASNTPTFDSSNLGTDLPAPFDLTINSLNTLTNNAIATNNHNNTTFTFPNFDSETNFVLPLNSSNQIDVSNLSASNADADQSTRFGQITMETRSTRKFLIKHHPYLQLNSNINNNSTNTNKLFNQQRPSINLIKMKKLCSKSTNLKMNEHQLSDASPSQSAAVTRSSGRISRSNLVDKEDDSKLLKFTDTAPQIANPNQSSYSLRVKNSTSNLKTTTTTNTVKSSHRKSSSSKTSSKTTSSNLTNPNQTGKTEEWCCCFNSDNYNETSNDYDVNNCFEEYDDDQEEDSSGYYSSYQSVDLVSTSGGGSIVGDKQDSKSSDLKPNQNTHNQQQQQQTQSTQPAQQQVPVPQHHYHTRYLTNFLQQTNSTTSSNLSSPNTSNRTLTTTPKNPILSSNTTPTTRLRYQQQLAAAAAAASKTSPTNMKHYYASHQATSSRFHEQYQLECDLDLDQIEND